MTRCKACRAPLSAEPEQEAGFLILRCDRCGTRNVIEILLHVIGVL